MKRPLLALTALGTAVFGSIPAVHADFRSAQTRFDELSETQQVAVALALIATGDFDGVIDFGFTRRLYASIRKFERRNGLTADGVLEDQELRTLVAAAEPMLSDLGNSYYAHPAGYSKLLVPRDLFDSEGRGPNEVLFSRADHHLSLSYIVFPRSERSFEDIYATMTKRSPARNITYTRRFRSHFVVTGTFGGKKFYTWINRLPDASVGFTLSWSDAWDPMGRKLSALLANSLLITSAGNDQQ
jgi:serine protease Do